MESKTLSLGELYSLLEEYTRETLYPPGRRVQLALACYSIARDHYLAIAVLTEDQLTASAFALARPLYEATVKGMWLQHCVSDEQLEKYAVDAELPPISEWIKALSKSALPGATSSQISNVKLKYWKSLSSLVHTGHAQMTHWLSPNGVAPAYPEQAIRELINFAAYMVVVASIEKARLRNDENAIASISKHLPQNSDTYQ